MHACACVTHAVAALHTAPSPASYIHTCKHAHAHVNAHAHTRARQVVNGPEVLSKYVGQAEENIRNLFGEAEAEYKEKGDASVRHGHGV